MVGHLIEPLQFSRLLKQMRTSSNDINYRFNVSRRHRYIYVATPKVAATSIKATLQSAEGRDTKEIGFHEIHNKKLSPLLSPEDDLSLFHELLNTETAFRFTFVRHPYTRLLSAYLDKISLRSATDPIAKRQARRSKLDLLSEDEVTFEQFVRAVQNARPTELDPHWRPLNLLTVPQLLNYNIIGRFERFSQDFQSVIEQIGLNQDGIIARREHSTGASDLLQRYYTPNIQSIVDDIYRDDFDLFGYERRLDGIRQLR